MTVRHVAQRIPFRPSSIQKALLERCFGARRFVYNQQVEAFDSYDKDVNAAKNILTEAERLFAL